MDNTQQDLGQLLQIRRDKLAALQEAGRDPFVITKYDQTHHTDEVKALYEEHEAQLLAGRELLSTEGMDEAAAREAANADYNERRAIMDAQPINVSVAGRMMFKRVMGKASFCNIRDLKGDIQVYVARDAIGEDAYAEFKKSDIGDIYGIKGFAFRTKTGEISYRKIEQQRCCDHAECGNPPVEIFFIPFEMPPHSRLLSRKRDLYPEFLLYYPLLFPSSILPARRISFHRLFIFPSGFHLCKLCFLLYAFLTC